MLEIQTLRSKNFGLAYPIGQTPAPPTTARPATQLPDRNS
jgi:hypothetical protein